MTRRIETTFANAKKAGRGTLGVFVTAGDPDAASTSILLDALVGAGVDFIELGMPFSDPMADGPAIQAASLRALKGGMTLAGTLELAAEFRKRHPNTPLILMGYYNPVYIYGNNRFIADALAAGVDGLIIVDLPPEEDTELCLPAKDAGLKFIRLVTPTSDETAYPPFWQRPAVLFIMCRCLVSPAPRAPLEIQFPMHISVSARKLNCRLLLVLASAHQHKPPKPPASQMGRLWDLPLLILLPIT